MKHRFLIFFYGLIFLIAVPFFFYIIGSTVNWQPQAMAQTENKVLYDLPYPGILPDHPLYFIKAIRDRAMELSTRDQMSKAQLLLLFADKRLSMALQLERNGKHKLALSTLSKAEKYLLRTAEILPQAKKQGSAPYVGFVNKIKLSSQKHSEIINTLAKEIPQGEEAEIQNIRSILQQVQNILKTL
jgi:hypothetical protein